MPANTPNFGFTYATYDDANDLALITQRIAEQMDSAMQPVAAKTNVIDTTWQTYTPTVYAGTSVVTVGNGTLKGRYLRHGKSCKVNIVFMLGSTTSYGGTGLLSFALPFVSDAVTWNGIGQSFPVGEMRAVNSGGGVNGQAIILAGGGDPGRLYSLAMTGPNATVANNDAVSSTSTLTATGHYITLNADYPLA